jgi:hypothetical protein
VLISGRQRLRGEVNREEPHLELIFIKVPGGGLKISFQKEKGK